MVWSRQRQIASLRSALRQYFPAALAAFPELGASEALEVLALAPTPQRARELSRAKIASALRRAGRVRRVEERAAEIQAALRTEHPEAPPLVAKALGRAATASCAVARTLGAQATALEQEFAERFRPAPGRGHPRWPARARAGAGRPGALRVRRRAGALRRGPGAQELRRHLAITRASGRSRVVLAMATTIGSSTRHRTSGSTAAGSCRRGGWRPRG
jgi:hypothetical protein